MTGVLTGHDGRRHTLPVMLEWKLQHTCGTPCDSFEVLCPWGAELEAALSRAVYFEAAEGDKKVFRGVVDEYECRWSEEGSRLYLSGRGMAALLLDNEATPADYQMATLDDILRRHVNPYGIVVASRGSFSTIPGFSVESGSSEWQVLRSFVKYHGGIEPYFDREGRLVLSGYGGGTGLLIDEKTPVTQITYRERRYGVLSEVLVLDRARQASQRVADQERIDRGYRCRRVVTTPGRSNYRTMRYSGEFQLKESGAERLVLEVTLPGVFAAWPGDIVEWRRAKPALGGRWRVWEAESAVDARGARTKLVLREVGN